MSIVITPTVRVILTFDHPDAGELPDPLAQTCIVTIDRNRYPYVEATVTIQKYADPTVNDAIINTLTEVELQLDADTRNADYRSWTGFYLVPISIETHDETDTIELRLASREAALMATSTDTDRYFYGPRSVGPDAGLETNLADLLNRAFDGIEPIDERIKAPSATADVTPRWDLNNLIYNSRANVNTEGAISLFQDGGNGTLSRTTEAATLDGSPIGSKFSLSIGSAPTGGGRGARILWGSGTTGTTIPVTPGAPYTFRAHVYHTGSTDRSHRVRMQFLDAAGNAVRSAEDGGLVPRLTWQALSVTAFAPSNAVRVTVDVEALNLAVGSTVNVSGVTLVESTFPAEWFDGGRPNDDDYVYAWDGPVNASTSRRVANNPIDPDLLVWHVGKSAWDFAQPLVNAAGLRLYDPQYDFKGYQNPADVWHFDQLMLIDPGTYRAVTTQGGTVSIYAPIVIWPEDLTAAGNLRDLTDPSYGATGVLARFTWNDPVTGNPRTREELAGTGPRIKNIDLAQPYAAGIAAAHLRKIRGYDRSVRITTIRDSLRITPNQDIIFTMPDGITRLGLVDTVTYDMSTGFAEVTIVDVSIVPNLFQNPRMLNTKPFPIVRSLGNIAATIVATTVLSSGGDGITTGARVTTSAVAPSWVRISSLATPLEPSVRELRTYTFSSRIAFRAGAGTTDPATLTLHIHWKNSAGVIIRSDAIGEDVAGRTGTSSSWETLTLTAEAPEGAVTAALEAGVSSGLPADSAIYTTAWCFTETPFQIPIQDTLEP